MTNRTTILEDLPKVLKRHLSNPEFSIEDATFCIWRTDEDHSWKHGEIVFPPGEDPDGSEDLLALLDGNPKTYQTWAEEYYEREIDLKAVKHIYEHKPLTDSILTALNPEVSWVDLADDIREIGYPR